MKGKLLVVDGTDCSGKETQTNLLLNRLTEEGYKVSKFSFPNYDSPTGKIIGGPYLGKEHICKGWFKEGAAEVDPKVASLYYAADRLYNIANINKALEENDLVLLDRYTISNMGHQGCKAANEEETKEIINFIAKLEYDLLELPKPDITVFLHMPYEAAVPLREKRNEKLDELESNESHLRKAEATYVYMAEKFGFTTIECAENDVAKPIDVIHENVYNSVKNFIASNERIKNKK